MSLFAVFHLTIFITQLGFLLFELTFRYLPEGFDLVTFKLKVVALFSLAVKLFSNTNNMLFELFMNKKRKN